MNEVGMGSRGTGAVLQPLAAATSLPMEGWMLRFFRQQAVHWLIVLGLVELLVLVGSVFAAIYLRYITTPSPLRAYVSTWWLQFGRAGIFAVVLMLGLAALGLYQTHLRESWFGVLARQAVGFALGWVGLVVIYYIIPEARIGRGILALALLIAFIGIAGFRALSMRLVDVEALKRRVLVLGAGSRAALIPQTMRRRADRRGFSIVGFMQQGNEAIAVSADRVIALRLAAACLRAAEPGQRDRGRTGRAPRPADGRAARVQTARHLRH